ncbi:conserved hypothetical protein [Methylobacterium sp. 4-46]|uniref:hypothetical protein n=1 Tax=unclassified Methylobacterium TaxID=2615210 RepID=UPI000152DB2F|nr:MULTISPECIES: hypothetical protein [Methylobacterium]ACA14598.1 conserved hypothetical protein [Methylobacterium sp. 4-46]WFT80354.1 hypothetical protein QA634_00055 [Methylobacterium nodulans]
MSDGKDQAGDAPGTKAASAEGRLKDVAARARAALPRLRRPRVKLGLPVAALIGGLCVGAFGGGAAVALMGKGARAERAAVGLAEWKKLATRLDAQAAESARLAGDLKLVKERSGAAQAAAEAARSEAAAQFGQMAERLERIGKVGSDAAAKLAGLSDRIEHLDREQQARVAALGERLDRQRAAAPAPVAVAPAPAPKLASAEPTLTGSLPDKPAAKPAAPAAPSATTAPAMVDSWVLRDVYDGVAMIENRNRRLIEVGPGDTVPGVGRVEAIERRGKAWVVVTSRGLITPQIW